MKTGQYTTMFSILLLHARHLEDWPIHNDVLHPAPPRTTSWRLANPQRCSPSCSSTHDILKTGQSTTMFSILLLHARHLANHYWLIITTWTSLVAVGGMTTASQLQWSTAPYWMIPLPNNWVLVSHDFSDLCSIEFMYDLYVDNIYRPGAIVLLLTVWAYLYLLLRSQTRRNRY